MPAQILLLLATIIIDGVRFVFTIIVTPLLVAVGDVTQLTFDVSTQVTTSVLFNVVDVNVELLIPAFTPFTFH